VILIPEIPYDLGHCQRSIEREAPEWEAVFRFWRWLRGAVSKEGLEEAARGPRKIRTTRSPKEKRERKKDDKDKDKDKKEKDKLKALPEFVEPTGQPACA